MFRKTLRHRFVPARSVIVYILKKFIATVKKKEDHETRFFFDDEPIDVEALLLSKNMDGLATPNESIVLAAGHRFIAFCRRRD